MTDFTFTCPETNRVFFSEQFEVIDNMGVKTDASGTKYLDAKLKLTRPCPFCGKHHIFRASEMACPFTGA